MAEFDAYLMVDWSAANRPRTGADSIWYCLLEADRQEVRNVATRAAAWRRLGGLLRERAARGMRVLAGFDFPLGYPAGFARALGLRGAPPWRAAWEEIARLIDDREDNRNNRFAAAAEFNRRISGRAFPFWGCPRGAVSDTLAMTRPGGYGGELAEYRLADRAAPGAQPVWKLCYAGSAGGQALTGIPRVLALRDDPVLATVARVWPFETGLCLPSRREALIVFAEVYPSLTPLPPGATPCKDAAQVRALAGRFARAGAEGWLKRLFEPPLEAADRARVIEAEGWILGAPSGIFPCGRRSFLAVAGARGFR